MNILIHMIADTRRSLYEDKKIKETNSTSTKISSSRYPRRVGRYKGETQSCYLPDAKTAM